jgi:hypothetical protein
MLRGFVFVKHDLTLGSNALLLVVILMISLSNFLPTDVCTLDFEISYISSTDRVPEEKTPPDAVNAKIVNMTFFVFFMIFPLDNLTLSSPVDESGVYFAFFCKRNDAFGNQSAAPC